MRASCGGGTTFADKINFSNSTDADSQDLEIAADDNNVIITWLVVRASTDNGATFGPLLRLATNGTIRQAAGVQSIAMRDLSII